MTPIKKEYNAIDTGILEPGYPGNLYACWDSSNLIADDTGLKNSMCTPADTKNSSKQRLLASDDNVNSAASDLTYFTVYPVQEAIDAKPKIGLLPTGASDVIPKRRIRKRLAPYLDL